MLGGTRLFATSPPRRLGESLARPLRARGRPARTNRVWAADASGCYDRVRVQTFAIIPRPRSCPFKSVRTTPVFLQVARVCTSTPPATCADNNVRREVPVQRSWEIASTVSRNATGGRLPRSSASVLVPSMRKYISSSPSNMATFLKDFSAPPGLTTSE